MFFSNLCTFSQTSSFKIEGLVKDASTNTSLPGAAVYVINNNSGTITDEKGFFQMETQKASLTIQFSYLGYREVAKTIQVSRDTFLLINLQPVSITSSEVVISASNEKVSNAEIGKVKLLQKDIAHLPSVGGERDLLKTLMLTPGIQSVSEGSSGLYVRGGNAGENLILLDDMPLYNPNHLLGFFPVFNAPVIKNIEIIKGIDDPETGGRLSSVVRANMKEGDTEKLTGEINSGLLSSSLTLSGPVGEKTQFLISARKTYLSLIQDLVLKKLMPDDNFIQQTRYGFQDYYLKTNHQLSAKDKLRFNFYGGFDDYLLDHRAVQFKNDMDWHNLAASATWLHSLSNVFYNRLTAGYTSYAHHMDASFTSYVFTLGSNIKDYYVKNVLTYQGLERHMIKGGVEVIRHRNKPGEVNAQALSVDYQKRDIYFSNELSAFVNDKITLSSKLSVNAGLRCNFYAHVGPFEVVQSDQLNQPLDTLKYMGGERIYSTYSFEPRVIANYKINATQSIKAGMARITQPIHLIPVGGVSLPSDIWFSSTWFAPPATSWQYSAGYYKDLKKNQLQFSMEAYYKTMQNLIDRKKSILNNFDEKTLGESFTTGSGQAAGIEFFLQKVAGDFNGWLSYTYSTSLRRFDDLNDGKPFVSKYDRPHDFSAVLNYRLNDKWSVSGVFVYATGSAMTLPVGRYSIQGIIVNDYTGVNEFRLPDYHRLDVSLNYTRQKKWGEYIWNFSVYNVYNRSNPYYLFFEAEADIDNYYLKVEPKRISLYPVLPSLSLIFKF